MYTKFIGIILYFSLGYSSSGIVPRLGLNARWLVDFNLQRMGSCAGRMLVLYSLIGRDQYRNYDKALKLKETVKRFGPVINHYGGSSVGLSDGSLKKELRFCIDKLSSGMPFHLLFQDTEALSLLLRLTGKYAQLKKIDNFSCSNLLGHIDRGLKVIAEIDQGSCCRGEFMFVKDSLEIDNSVPSLLLQRICREPSALSDNERDHIYRESRKAELARYVQSNLARIIQGGVSGNCGPLVLKEAERRIDEVRETARYFDSRAVTWASAYKLGCSTYDPTKLDLFSRSS